MLHAVDKHAYGGAWNVEGLRLAVEQALQGVEVSHSFILLTARAVGFVRPHQFRRAVRPAPRDGQRAPACRTS
ncbi:hypothetical protein GCM10010412_000560 [Nonomuraea recticatena]|uniref:Uncharacterized protein n=1 Tax=Nonomuraea recticatena TaxID=46178 RepID=A0ABN3R1T5_9ACTN